MKSYWLIEFVGAIPSPVYVPESFDETGGFLTMNPWRAKRFYSKDAAEFWMNNPNGCLSYNEPWTAIEHGFEE